MITKQEIESKALEFVAGGEAPLWGGGFVEGATWANKQNEKELATLRSKVEVLQGAAELIAVLKDIKTAVDEYRADMEISVYRSIQIILNKYESDRP